MPATHVFSLTNGVSTVTLTSSPYIVEKYDMKAAMADALGNFKSVVERIELTVVGSSQSDAQTQMTTLERMVNEIQFRKVRPNEQKMYIQAQLMSDTQVWRSEILDASITVRESGLSSWPSAYIPCTLTIERKFFWEGAEAYLTIANNGGSTANGLTVSNYAGSGYGNHMLTGVNDVKGTLPAPCRLEILNATGGSQNFRRFWAWNNAYSSPATMTYNVEAEATTSTTSDVAGTYSGGFYTSFTVNTTFQLKFSLATAQLTAAGGRDFRILGVFPTIGGAGAWVKIHLYLPSGSGDPLYATNEVYISSNGYYIKDLGVISLPPGGYSATWDTLVVSFEFRSTSSVSIGMDFFMIAATDSFVQVEQPAYLLDINDIVMIDSMSDQAYVRNAANAKDWAMLVKLDKELLLFPGKTNKIHILVDGLGYSIGWQFTCKLAYRPRRLTV